MILDTISLLFAGFSLLVSVATLFYVHSQFQREHDHQCVMLSTTVNQLRSPLRDLSVVTIEFENMSKYPAPYSVRIETNGFGVYWPNVPLPNRLFFNLLLNEGETIVPSGGRYQQSFCIVHSVEKYEDVCLSVFVNGRMLRQLWYDYRESDAAYVYKRG